MKRVTGIGNALVDIMIHLPDRSLPESFGMAAGSMEMVDGKRYGEVYSAAKKMIETVSAGGSVANTMHSLGILGVKPGYIGAVGSDEYGHFFSSEMESAGVKPVLFRGELPTGTALALVTPDGERTFATFLGAAITLAESDISARLFEGYDILYLEGYLIFNLPLVIRSLQLAKEAGMTVALDLSSYNIVEDQLDAFRMVVTDYVDILFANEEEVKAFTGLDAEEALEMLSATCDIVVIKRGERGSLICQGSERVSVGVINANVIDTTGAGDMYAAGFLYGFANEANLERCGAMGALLAGSIIEVTGAKMSRERWDKLLQNTLFTTG